MRIRRRHQDEERTEWVGRMEVVRLYIQWEWIW